LIARSIVLGSVIVLLAIVASFARATREPPGA
jgi:hypothetical protein